MKPKGSFLSRRQLLRAPATAGAWLASAARGRRAGVRRDIAFDVGWQFVSGDPVGAHLPDHADSGWRTLDLPHYWSIEDR